MKVCTKCKVEKELAEFYVNLKCKGGLYPYCKVCARAIQKAYLENPDRINKQRMKKQTLKRQKKLGVKVCTACGVEQDLAKFNQHTYKCKACCRVTSQARYRAKYPTAAKKRDLKKCQIERGVRTCLGCGIEKALTEFYVDHASRDKCSSRCKLCAATYAHKHHYAKYPEAVKKRTLKEQQLKRGVKTCTLCETEKKLTEFNKRRVSVDGRVSRCTTCTTAAARAYDQTYAGKKYRHKYRASKKGKAAGRRGTRRHRAFKCTTTVEPVNEDAIYKRCKNKCIYCGSKKKLSLDHVVPLSRGGSHIQSNLVVACRSCNSSKNATPLNTWLKTRTRNRGKENLHALQQTDAFSFKEDANATQSG